MDDKPFFSTMTRLHIDIETYSDVDLKNSGVYKYVSSDNFEILMIAYAFDDNPVQIIDLCQLEEIPDLFITAINNPNVVKIAHNAVFERLCFKKYGFNVPSSQWECTQVKAAYCGLPLSLDEVSKVLNDPDKVKSSTGKALIRYFSIPCKPTKTNKGRTRNLPHHNLTKWNEFKSYCCQDVEAERSVDKKLARYKIPDVEFRYYQLDQKINDSGVRLDIDLATKATALDDQFNNNCIMRLKEITGLDNPNSLPQLKNWLSSKIGDEITSLTKDDIPYLLSYVENEAVREVLKLRQQTSKASIKKYLSILKCNLKGFGHGFFQFYGANRTGRWAGRLVQLHNLVRNKLGNLHAVRQAVKNYNLETLQILHGDLSYLLSQLIRTNFIPKEGNVFAVADFSAIEARITAWLSDETWRLEVFDTHGKIYEASASTMFNIPIDQIDKGSELRQKGKIAELALGYQGGVGALLQMGAEEMGLSDKEMKSIIKRWRVASPQIVKLWKELEICAKKAIRKKRVCYCTKNRKLGFVSDSNFLMMVLPSGRKLFYYSPSIRRKTIYKQDGDSFEVDSITYMGLNDKKKWARLDTYGGKLLENACQAVARDLLAHSMVQVDDAGYEIVMHVHDENVCDIPEFDSDNQLKDICELMEIRPSWAEDLALVVDGYLTPFYRKD